jgi:hypothetical protein
VEFKARHRAEPRRKKNDQEPLIYFVVKGKHRQIMFKYFVENGTGMELGYTVVGARGELVSTGVIPRSSPERRQRRGTNPSWSSLSDSATLRVTVWSEQTPAKPGKTFVMDGSALNFITVLCPNPFEEECDPLDTVFAGRWLPYAPAPRMRDTGHHL